MSFVSPTPGVRITRCSVGFVDEEPVGCGQIGGPAGSAVVTVPGDAAPGDTLCWSVFYRQNGDEVSVPKTDCLGFTVLPVEFWVSVIFEKAHGRQHPHHLRLANISRWANPRRACCARRAAVHLACRGRTHLRRDWLLWIIRFGHVADRPPTKNEDREHNEKADFHRRPPGPPEALAHVRQRRLGGLVVPIGAVHDGPQVAEAVDDPGHDQDDDDSPQRDAGLFFLGRSGQQHELTVPGDKPAVITQSGKSIYSRRG